ncbi:hypothetical protein GUJ93_ZPchr0003g16511 [Zizania palustris]|uniref:Uncharacterized protein n=1 Tax=Zizania palustris TaxID=103762 RepID=A0A8J5VDS1_ZIZPA|nr:hypothetical protein GUJ93_ZPchr0003g16511 [Zizania palustris]
MAATTKSKTLARQEEEELGKNARKFTHKNLQSVTKKLLSQFVALAKGTNVLSKEEIFLACTLGWCREWDNSQTRCGQICWFTVPQVEFKTISGQLLDLITTHEGEKYLTKYNLTVAARFQRSDAMMTFVPTAEDMQALADLQQAVANLRTYLGLAPVASMLPSFPHSVMGFPTAPTPSPIAVAGAQGGEVGNADGKRLHGCCFRCRGAMCVELSGEVACLGPMSAQAPGGSPSLSSPPRRP